MTLRDFDPQQLMQSARQQIACEPALSPALKTTIEPLITLCLLLLERLPKNSNNSSLPPSMDLNRLKKQKAKNQCRPGGQHGRIGRTLKTVDHPDQVEFIEVDHQKLPPGRWRDTGGYLHRQVFEVAVHTFVTEYRAQIMIDNEGREIPADFPEGVVSATQYGSSVNAMSVYLSQFQLLPYDRIADLFAEQMMLPLSPGSVCNFNQEAFKALENFEGWVSKKLTESDLLKLDETSININGQRVWLHLAANDHSTRYYPHRKRGLEAVIDMAILPNTSAILCHGHWKPYFFFPNKHALCNAHHSCPK